MSEILRECPFCGGMNVLDESGAGFVLEKTRCQTCGAQTFPRWGVSSRERWNQRAYEAPSSWHDASEKPDSGRLCLVEYHTIRVWNTVTRRGVYDYSAVRREWRDEDGDLIERNANPRRWKYLDTSDAAPKGEEMRAK